MQSKYLILPVVAVLLLGILAAVMRAPQSSVQGETACTQEAMICPDGSAVGRTGPKCEFAPCPNIVGSDLSHGNISAAPASQTVSKNGYSFLVATSSVQISKGGKILETIVTDPERSALAAVDGEIITADKLIVSDLDVNFDGNPDLGILTGVGYGGVNYFYDFYLFDPKAGMFAKTPALTEIGNPSTDPAKKEVISSYRSGPEWYSHRYDMSGSSVIDLGQVSDESVQ